jgi:5-methylcytosine-specific restriction protein B
MTWVADIVDAANAKLDRHMQIGPSHFMREDLTEMWVRRTWKFTVLPYIEEQYFDDHDQLQQFDLDRLRHQTTSAPATRPPAQEGEIVDDDGDDHRVDAPHHQS